MGGGVLVMAVASVDLEFLQLRKTTARVVAALEHHGEEQGVERGDVGQAAGALERLEEVAGIDVGLTFVGVVLEEFLAGLGVAYAAEDAELGEVEIADECAMISTIRGGIYIN